MAAPFQLSVDSVVVVIGAGAGGGVREAAEFVPGKRESGNSAVSDSIGGPIR